MTERSAALAPRSPDSGSAVGASPASCDTCAAACCRLEALCITETGVPERYLRGNAGGVPSMLRLADGWCAALDRDSMRCRIYARRPLVCRELEVGGPDCLAARSEWMATAGLPGPRNS